MIFKITALIAFVLAQFAIPVHLNLIALGLALWVAGELVGERSRAMN